MNNKEKRKIMVDFGRLTPDMRKALNLQYPFGVRDEMMRIRNSSGKPVLAVLLETDDATFLVSLNPNNPQAAMLIADDVLPDETWSDDFDDDNEDNDMDNDTPLEIEPPEAA